MSGAPQPRMHGATHVCGASDPIPGICELTTGGGAFTTYRDCTLARPGLFSFWPFDEASGNAVDILAARNMTVTTGGGFPVYAQPGPFPDQPDTSIEFGGSGGGGGAHDRMEVSWGGTSPGDAFHDTFRGTHAFTVEMWIYPEVAQIGRLFEFWGGGSTDWVLLDRVAAGYVVANRGSDGTIGGAGVTDAALNAWTHVRLTYDGAQIELFLNGVSAGTDASTFSITGAAQISVGNNRNTGGSGWTPFNGRIADVAVYTSAVTDFCDTVTPEGPGTPAGAAGGKVWTADGLGAAGWEYPTIAVDDPAGRYDTIKLGTNLTGTDEGDGSITINAAGGSPTGAAGGDLSGTYPNPDVAVVDNSVLGSGTPSSSTFLRGDRTWAVPPSGATAHDTAVWLPLTTTVSGDDVLVFDADHSLVPTLIPF